MGDSESKGAAKGAAKAAADAAPAPVRIRTPGTGEPLALNVEPIASSGPIEVAFDQYFDRSAFLKDWPPLPKEDEVEKIEFAVLSEGDPLTPAEELEASGEEGEKETEE